MLVPTMSAAAAAAAAAPSAPEGSGWFYDLLTRAGVAPATASDLVQFVWRPLAVVLVLAGALLVATLGARGLRHVLDGAASRAAQRSGSARAGTRATTVVSLLVNLFRFVIVLVALFIVLGMLGIDLTPVLASATVIGAILAFGAQQLVRDYLSGFLLALEDQFGIGDTVSVNDVHGVVDEVSLRVTRVRADDGTVWYVPNGDIRKLANLSRGWARATVDLVVPAAAADLPALRAALLEAATAVARDERFTAACPESPQVLGATASDAETVTVTVTLRTTSALRAPLERELRQALLGARDALARRPPPPPAASG